MTNAKSEGYLFWLAIIPLAALALPIQLVRSDAISSTLFFWGTSICATLSATVAAGIWAYSRHSSRVGLPSWVSWPKPDGKAATYHGDHDRHLLACIVVAVLTTAAFTLLALNTDRIFRTWTNHGKIGGWPSQQVPGSELAKTATKIELQNDASLREIANSFRRRVFRVDVTCTLQERGGIGRRVEAGGSAILVANTQKCGLVVTNLHVADPGFDAPDLSATDVQILLKPGDESVMLIPTLVAVSEEHDLALLLVERDFDDVEVVSILKQGEIRQGDEVLSLGSPLGVEYLAVPGIVSGKAGEAILHSCTLDPGSSGGPLLSMRGGQLAGINTAVAGRSINAAVPADLLVQKSWLPSSGRFSSANWKWETEDEKQRALATQLIGLLRIMQE